MCGCSPCNPPTHPSLCRACGPSAFCLPNPLSFPFPLPFPCRVQVTRLAAQMQARAYGAPVVAPQSEPIWGVVERAAPFQGSAIAEYIYGEDVPLVPVTNPVTNTPPQVSRQGHQRKCTPCACWEGGRDEPSSARLGASVGVESTLLLQFGCGWWVTTLRSSSSPLSSCPSVLCARSCVAWVHADVFACRSPRARMNA